jgi:hypothetical protein
MMGATMKTWLTGARVGARMGLAAAVLCCAAPATAGEFDYRLSLGAGHSDNPGHVATNEEDTSFATAGARFSYDERTPKLRADLVGDLAYYDYLNDAFDSEVVGNVYAFTSFAFVPERFVWTASDQFGQLPTDPFLPAGPDNRENINSFSTGPDFFVGLGSEMRLRLGGRYSLIDYEEDPLDSTVTGGQLGIMRALSGRSSISLNASVQQFEYEDVALNADFDQTNTYLTYEVEGARTNLTIDAGYTQLDREALTDSESGMLLRVDASRRISGSSTLTLEGGREFSTSAGAFASEQGDTYVGLGVSPGRQSADPFTLDHMALGWNFNRNLTGLAVLTSWSKRTFDDNPALDQTSIALSARFRRDLSPTRSLQISAAHMAVRYEPPAVDYNELTAGVAFSWRLARNLALDVSYDFARRGRDVSFAGYTENRLWLGIGYGRGEPRTSRVAPTFGVDAQMTPGR